MSRALKPTTDLANRIARIYPSLSEGHRKALVGEFADLWFHSMVAMAHLGVSPRDVVGELARREGLSGLEEFAARSKPAAGPQGA